MTSIENKIHLHDGEKKIDTIAVMIMVKNNAPYLLYWTQQWEAMERMYDVQFEYFVFENDSTDDSKTLLELFMQHRSGRLISENGHSRIINKECNYERVHALADFRNRLLQNVRPLSCDWLLVMDTGIFFEVDILCRMFACQPKTNGIIVHGVNSKQVNASKKQKGKFVTAHHYYDSYALVDVDDRSYYPLCRFNECTVCPARRGKLATYDPSLDLIDVRAAFGGFLLVDGNIVNESQLKWRPCEMKYGQLSLTEHIYFCDSARILSGGKRIVVHQHIRDVYWDQAM
jgi:hypothetical protein